jgi:hypothetical protein
LRGPKDPGPPYSPTSHLRRRSNSFP